MISFAEQWSVKGPQLACFKMTIGPPNIMTFLLHDIYRLNARKIRINEQKSTGQQFLKNYKGKALIL